MKTFDELWKWVMDRSHHGVMTVQEKSELEHIYDLMFKCGCKNYLEVGTAEGNSLYVLSHAVEGPIDIIDFGETHTKPLKDEVINSIYNHVDQFLGDSTDPETLHLKEQRQYDCILIDGGHDFATVLSDAILYAPLARKYVFFHDIQLPEVKRAVEWFVKRWKLGKYSTFINSPSFGYAIIEVGK